jgi:hypothetical protein
MPIDFYVWTFVYDFSGVGSVNLMWRQVGRGAARAWTQTLSLLTSSTQICVYYSEREAAHRRCILDAVVGAVVKLLFRRVAVPVGCGRGQPH